MSDDLPYQVQPQVKQLLAERANADALGLTDRVAAADKQLAALGYKEKAAKARAAAAEEDGGKSQAPKGRSARPSQTADE